MLEEAAAELFLEQGYDATTVDDIAGRAGISRSAFFSYFASKADVLWREMERALDRIDVSGPSMDEAVATIVAAVEPWGSAVPWTIRDAEVMGTVEVLQATSVARLEPVAKRMAIAFAGSASHDEWGRYMLVSGALIGTTVGALVEWGGSPAGRPTAAEAVSAALAPIARVYGPTGVVTLPDQTASTR